MELLLQCFRWGCQLMLLPIKFIRVILLELITDNKLVCCRQIQLYHNKTCVSELIYKNSLLPRKTALLHWTYNSNRLMPRMLLLPLPKTSGSLLLKLMVLRVPLLMSL